MPDLPNRQRSESMIESAIMPIFRRWAREIRRATTTVDPLTVNQSERESIQLALADPFVRASARMAADFGIKFDESLSAISTLFIVNFADAIADSLASVTNQKVAAAIAEIEEGERQAATDAVKPEKTAVDLQTKNLKATVETVVGAGKSIGRKVLGKIMSLWLSAKRAAKIAVTETTRMVTAGERIVANVWNRTVGRKAGAESEIAAAIAEQSGDEIPVSDQTIKEPSKLVARWFTESDDRVCPLCQPLHKLYEWQWPSDVTGSPRHVRCRCWLEWEIVPISKIPNPDKASRVQ